MTNVVDTVDPSAVASESPHPEASAFVGVDWLARRLPDPDVVVIEVTDDPDHVDGPGVIPGARSVFWKRLLWHETSRRFADPADLAERLRVLGAGEDRIVVFAGRPAQFAAYAIWVARVVGVGGELRYLDGGLPAWELGHGSPTGTSPTVERRTPASALPLVTPLSSAVIDRDGVRRAIDSESVIVDLRTPEEYAGERVAPDTEPIDHGAQRHGHIPGARPLHVNELLDDAGRVLPADALRRRVAGLDAADATELVFYCRLSHRAALGWLVVTDILSDPRVRVYDGSWTEWGSIVGTPIER
ncbi:sulfurtransferase [Gordonia sp. HS-NH1]|uniref:sulfurtransferase n=1 Tax=Gordonia sp. HS-NH1 TaxID=1435068 RepID=UPI0006E1710F|nr:rhodanese-like domain-containing protein [Gordonia sp. HS-NH1]